MTNNNRRIGLPLQVTIRPHVTSVSRDEEWEHPTVDEFLDMVVGEEALKRYTLQLQDDVIKYHELGNSSDGEVEDQVIEPLFLKEPYKTEFKERKRNLKCVHPFGHFVSQNGKMVLTQPSGIVTLDIDFKPLLVAEFIPADYKDLLETELINYFFDHSSAIYLYHSASNQGVHMGFYTDAETAEQYKDAYNKLCAELIKKLPRFGKEGVVDRSVGRHNANFFVPHSPLVLRKAPAAKYLSGTVKLNPGTAEPVIPQEKQPEKENGTVIECRAERKEFPYVDDFQLFLTYEQREKGTYFDGFEEWRAMIYSLKAAYSLAYPSRIRYWFDKLSALSPNCNHAKNKQTFQKIMGDETANNAGVNFIIKHLARGKRTTRFPQYTLHELERYFKEMVGVYDQESEDEEGVYYIDQYLCWRIRANCPLVFAANRSLLFTRN